MDTLTNDDTLRYTFRKNERLCSQRLTDSLFGSRQRFVVFPFSITWKICTAEEQIPSSAQILIVAPKKRLRHAVDRNRAKRLIRECYRLKKQPLYDYLDEHHIKLLFSVSYIHTEPLGYHTLERKFDKAILQLIEQISSQI